MVFIRGIKYIIGLLTLSVGIYTGVEVYETATVIWKIGERIRISGVGGILLLVFPILLVGLICSFTNVKKTQKSEIEYGWNWIISIVGIGLNLFYSSLITFQNEASGNIFTKGWLSIKKQIPLENKMNWYLELKEVIYLEEKFWNKIAGLIDWDVITSKADLLNTVSKEIIILEQIEKNKPGFFMSNLNAIGTIIAAHPWLSLFTGAGIFGLSYIGAGKIALYGVLLGERVMDNCRNINEVTKEIAKFGAIQKELAEAMITLNKAVNDKATIEDLTMLSKALQIHAEELSVLKGLIPQIRDTKHLCEVLQNIIKKTLETE